MELLAFHGNKSVKKKYLARVRYHMAADHLTRGIGWSRESQKGCAVGCTLEDYNHAKYETELGIPEWLARLEDALFEGMSEEKSRDWPEKFLKAIWTGADLEQAKGPIMAMILEHSLQSMRAAKYDPTKFPQVKSAMDQVETAVAEMIRCHREGLDLTAAESAARSAAWSAESAARSAAWSAESAAESAAWSAESAAWSAARSAARSAAWSAESAAWSAESAAWSAARSASYDYYADQVLAILRRTRPKKEAA